MGYFIMNNIYKKTPPQKTFHKETRTESLKTKRKRKENKQRNEQKAPMQDRALRFNHSFTGSCDFLLMFCCDPLPMRRLWHNGQFSIWESIFPCFVFADWCKIEPYGSITLLLEVATCCWCSVVTLSPWDDCDIMISSLFENRRSHAWCLQIRSPVASMHV